MEGREKKGRERQGKAKGRGKRGGEGKGGGNLIEPHCKILHMLCLVSITAAAINFTGFMAGSFELGYIMLGSHYGCM